MCGSFIKGEFLQVQKFETESKYCDISLSYLCFAHLCYDGLVVFQSSLFYVYFRGKVLLYLASLGEEVICRSGGILHRDGKRFGVSHGFQRDTLNKKTNGAS